MHLKKIFLVLIAALFSATTGAAQKQSAQPPVEEIIRQFATAESQNKVARNNYTFTQDVDLLTVGEAGSITGRYRRTSDIVYDDLGNRIERITFFPASTLRDITITPEDLQDLAGVQPFALTLEDLPKYQIDYVGKERIDELNLYIFNVKPKRIVKGERYLEGRVWVDDQDLQIVKVAGKGVPETDTNKFPHFETYRENIDGRYWFPTYTHADDVLEFKRNPLRIRMTIRYTNYKKFSTDIRVTDEGAATEEDVKAAEKPAADKSKPPAPAPQKTDNPQPKKPESKPPQKRP